MVKKSLGIRKPVIRACLMLQGETPVDPQGFLVAGFVFLWIHNSSPPLPGMARTMNDFLFKGWRKWLSILVMLLVLLTIYGLVSGAPEQVVYERYCGNISKIKGEAKKVDFKELDKDASRFDGTVAKFTGEVLQIQENGNEGVMRLGVTKDIFGWSVSDVVWVDYKNKTDILNEDIVTVYGVLTGNKSYTSQANFQITVPTMVACVIEKEAGKASSGE